MVSLALDREMEADWSAEEHKPSLVKPEDPTEAKAFSGPADMDLPTQMEDLQTPGQDGGEEPCRGGEEEMGSQREEGESHTFENYSDRENQKVGGRADGKKLRKTNSWKTVRFQDPSQTDVVLERDSSGESLFPDYVLEEWTFEELFKAKDWQNITGRIGNMQIHKYKERFCKSWCNKQFRPTFDPQQTSYNKEQT